MTQPDLYAPVTTPADVRDAQLVAMAESDGWRCLARVTEMELEVWRHHCQAGRWTAFAFCIEDGLIFGRFVGSRIVPARKMSRPGMTSKLFRKGPR